MTDAIVEVPQHVRRQRVRNFEMAFGHVPREILLRNDPPPSAIVPYGPEDIDDEDDAVL